MATGRDLQRRSAGGVLQEPRNRKERRKAQQSFRVRAKKLEQKRKRRKKALEIAGECVIGAALGLAIIGMLFIADDGSSYQPVQAQVPEQRWYADNSDHYYTSEEDYLQYKADKAAWEAEHQDDVLTTVYSTKTAYDANEIEIQQGTVEAADGLVKSLDFDGDDAYLLAKIAMAEAEGEDLEGKALVIRVVLNRVWSDGFPDSIEEVIFQPGQFSPVSNGRWYNVEPNNACWDALGFVEGGWDESQGATYFCAQGYDGWHSRNLQKLFTHGGHTFYSEVSSQ